MRHVSLNTEGAASSLMAHAVGNQNQGGFVSPVSKVGALHAGNLPQVGQIMAGLAGTGSHQLALSEMPSVDSHSTPVVRRVQLKLIPTADHNGVFEGSSSDVLQSANGRLIQLASAGQSDAVVNAYDIADRVQELNKHFVLNTPHVGPVQVNSGGHLEIKGVIAEGQFEVHGQLTVGGGDIKLHIREPRLNPGGFEAAYERFDPSGSAGGIDGQLTVKSGANVSIAGAFMGEITVEQGGTLSTAPGSLVIGKITNQGGTVNIGGTFRGARSKRFEGGEDGKARERTDHARIRGAEFGGAIKFLSGAQLNQTVFFNDTVVRGRADD